MTSSNSSIYDSFAIVDNDIVTTILNQANGDAQFVSILFDSFITEGQDTIKSIEIALNTNDYKKISEEIHALKGLAGTMGVSQVFEICKAMDAFFKQAKPTDALTLFPILTSKYLLAKEYITANYLKD